MIPPLHVAHLPGHSSKAVSLQCKVRRSADTVEVTYTAKNDANEDAYVLDLTPKSRTGDAGVDVEALPIYLAWLGGASAHLGQGIAPLPPNRDVAVRIIPLATRLVPGATLTRTLLLPNPLTELGPYDAPAPPSADAPSIDRLVVTLSALRPSTPGFNRDEVAGHPGVFRVASKDTVGAVERARCELSLTPTTLRVFRWDAAHGPTFERAD